MPITSNEGGTLYELDTVHSNEGGTLYELDTVHSNESGTLYEIHSGWKPPTELPWKASSAGSLSSTSDNGYKVTFVQNTSKQSRLGLLYSDSAISTYYQDYFFIHLEAGTKISIKVTGWSASCIPAATSKLVFGIHTQTAASPKQTAANESGVSTPLYSDMVGTVWSFVVSESRDYIISMGAGTSWTNPSGTTSFYETTATVEIIITKT